MILHEWLTDDSQSRGDGRELPCIRLHAHLAITGDISAFVWQFMQYNDWATELRCIYHQSLQQGIYSAMMSPGQRGIFCTLGDCTVCAAHSNPFQQTHVGSKSMQSLWYHTWTAVEACKPKLAIVKKRKEECETTAMRDSGRAMSHCMKRCPRALICSFSSRKSGPHSSSSSVSICTTKSAITLICLPQAACPQMKTQCSFMITLTLT